MISSSWPLINCLTLPLDYCIVSSKENNPKTTLCLPPSWWVVLVILNVSLSFTCISKALNVVIRMGPNQRFPFNTRSFFTPEGRKAIGGGLELWRGYFQSIRPSENRMYLNIDIATGIMYKPGQLLSLFMEFFKKNDPSAFSPKRGFPDRDRMRLQKFVSNMRVRTAHTGRDRSVVIKRLSATGASNTMFSMRDNEKPISVANYFRLHANITLKFPDNICIEVCLPFHLLSRTHSYLFSR